ncbi:long-chain fatty acid--CoA ligase [Streptomyces sp. 8L]|uniref:long-chain fatty acid--CoA ligase n=1 Tax=Streptomyces sp. 8L TaxID=2877242 RepID=UPI001CD6C612|nr:long-chain fatty acid--CoA ligase [Streptomyces sp. 8L]MCA1218872.1 long-chain fatty acid--CoA ligase [Streptomyces sp. 8L]
MMDDYPLTVRRILEHGMTVHARSTVSTWTGDAEPRRRTFAEIGQRSVQLAQALRTLGLTEGSVLGTLMWNNAEHVEAYLAIPAMGAILHTLNLRLPSEQLIYVANHAEDRVIIVNGSLLPLLAPVLPHLPTVEHVVVSGPGDRSLLAEAAADVQVHEYEELLAGQSPDFDAFDWPDLDERSGAAMCYTSGTTGDPKGVVFSHRSIYLHSMQANTTAALGLTEKDLTLVVVPQFHVNAWGVPHATFMVGANMLMPDRFLQPAPLADMIEQERPTHAAAVPTIWQGLLAEVTARPRDLSSMARVTIGGSACPPALMEAYDKLGVRVLHTWGMTETSPLGTTTDPPAGLTPEEEWPYRITQGHFPVGVEPRLAGPDGAMLPWDNESAGELEVRGPWVARAYYGGSPGKELVPEDKFSEDGWLRTGDVGVISPDGYLTLTDRAKDVIKSGGEWISSVSLENALMGHPAVLEAAVVAVPDDRWGERPLAVVVLKEGRAVGYPELKEFLTGRVERWQVPERWALVASVPKTSVGKFDKKVIRRQYANGELDVTRL